MHSWDTFEHDDAYDALKGIVQMATSMGARTGSCGERKLTIQWPDGCVVHIRRFVSGRFRWLLFTQAGCHAVFLSDRDPSPRELRGSGADCTPSSQKAEVALAGRGAACLQEI